MDLVVSKVVPLHKRALEKSLVSQKTMRNFRLGCRMAENISVTVERPVGQGVWLIAFMEFELLQ